MKKVFIVSAIFLTLSLNFSCKKDKPGPPAVTTQVVSAVSYTSAESGGTVTSEGGLPVMYRGVCWNTSANPTISKNRTFEFGGLGTFTATISQLTPNTVYYVRAYATNRAGTSYGKQVSFTSSSVTVPVITTLSITSLLSTSAISGGNITAANGSTITARGVCWSTETGPTTASNKTSDGIGSGNFTSNLYMLQSGTVYYIRSYATNSAGTSYGNEISFTTLPSFATITTSIVSSITQTTAISGGIITSDGGATVTARGVCWSQSQNPTTLDNVKTSGTGTGTFTCSLTGLKHSTTYYLRAYAVNNFGTVYGSNTTFTTQPGTIFNSNLTYGTVTDIDGNIYKTITIGAQTWMAENLKTIKYRNSDPIPNVTDNTAWNSLTTGAFSDYNNTSDNSTSFGKLYNFYCVTDTRNICPTGWHIPSDLEWANLIAFSGGESVAGYKMKETGSTHWTTGNTANNSVGFTALPGGYRFLDGTFYNLSSFGNWWSSTESSTTGAWYFTMQSISSDVLRYDNNKKIGLSVRCLKD